MRKFLLSLAFFVALGASSVYADRNPAKDRIVNRYDERAVYRDSRGLYHWQIIEREIWVPARRVAGLFGPRIIRGHYEIRRQRVKVYHSNRYYEQRRSSHPHGMPPGQRKKQDKHYDRR